MEEQDQVKHGPYLLVAPMLTYNVSRVAHPIQEGEVDELGCDGFMYMVK